MQYLIYTLSSENDLKNIRYVGATSKTLNQRMYHHKYCAKSRRVQPVHKWMWSKMQENIEIVIQSIEICDENTWQEAEKKWVTYYKDQGYNLLNISEGGCGIITKEQRDIDGRQRSIDAHKKQVCCIDPTTKKVIKVYNSIKEATKDIGLKSKSAIGNALKFRSPMCGGYYWAYKKDIDSGEFKLKEKNMYSYVKTPIVYQFDLNGNLLNKYIGVCDAAKNGCKLKSNNATCLNKAINEKIIYRNYYWSFSQKININEYKNLHKYVEYDKNNNIVCEYKSQKEIADKYKMSASAVCVRIKNNIDFNGNVIKCKN